MQVCRKFNTKLMSTSHVTSREIQKRNVFNIFETKSKQYAGCLCQNAKYKGEVGAVDARVKSM